MKSGRSLTELAQEIERQREAKHDYVADTTAMTMKDNGSEIVLGKAGTFGLTANARQQLANKLGLRIDYFDRLRTDYPALLAETVNTIAHKEVSTNMFRTLDGNLRGILSDKYRPLDYYDLADAVLPVAKEMGAVVASCQLTETKLYIKLLMPWLDRELPVPAGLKMGQGHNWFTRKIIGALTISDSEVGKGGLNLFPGIFEEQCTNLATFQKEGMRKTHIGRRHEADAEDDVTKYLTDETRRMDDAVVWAKVRDVVKATMDGRVMDEIANKLSEARGQPIQGDPTKVVELFSKQNDLSKDESGGLLRHLVNSGEMTKYGLQWAVTRLSQDVADYDRASDLERLGGQVIELPAHDWEVLAQAA